MLKDSWIPLPVARNDDKGWSLVVSRCFPPDRGSASFGLTYSGRHSSRARTVSTGTYRYHKGQTCQCWCIVFEDGVHFTHSSPHRTQHTHRLCLAIPPMKRGGLNGTVRSRFDSFAGPLGPEDAQQVSWGHQVVVRGQFTFRNAAPGGNWSFIALPSVSLPIGPHR